MITAIAVAHPNIAFIKYWGNRDAALRLPANGSISMNLSGLQTVTRVTYTDERETDELILNGKSLTGAALERVSQLLDRVRRQSGVHLAANVVSENNFPTGTGIASSASAFAALSLAASRAAGLELDEAALSRLARRGSGSACRSIPDGFVEWQAGEDDASSYAFSLAPADHWDLVDCVAVVSQAHKLAGSSEGHALAGSSPLQRVRIAETEARLEICRQAILQRDFTALADIVEFDSNLMHSVMMTSQPALIYWQPATLAVMQAVVSWRRKGLQACYTIDAGPNVHVITTGDDCAQVVQILNQVPGVQQVLQARPGRGAHLLEDG
jgi:diphosphomevalonate decarboxylase